MILVCDKCESDDRSYDWHCLGCKARARIYFRDRDANHADRTVYAEMDHGNHVFTLNEVIDDE